MKAFLSDSPWGVASGLRHAALAVVIVLAVAEMGVAVSEQPTGHPRLFFDAEDEAKFRKRAERAPWSDMLRAVEWAMDHDRNARYANLNPRPANPAILHVYRGSKGGRDYAAEALADTMFLIFAPDAQGKPVWADVRCRSLTRSMRGLQVAIAYDLCHEAWKELKVPAEFTTRDGAVHKVPAEFVGQPVNAFVSKMLAANSDSLVQSGGPGWPGDERVGNNWHAVRFAGAALGYLACDEPRAGWQKNFENALGLLMRHKEANLSRHPGAAGYNPEGIAYSQYPGWTTYPLLIALKRIEGRDLADELPAMRKELWANYQGILPIPRRSRLDNPVTKEPGLGLRPDFTDDHPVWEGEGTAALAFATCPPEYLPGLKWLFRRLCGDLGDQTWDAASGNGLYSLIFYPEELAEKNPAEVWGLTWRDESFGMYVFRNRFQDEKDIVAQIVAKLRPTFGGHEGRDALGFRIFGLGVPWAVGSGRTTDMRGQTSLFPRDPEEAGTPPPGLVPSVKDSFLRKRGDGYVLMSMELSDTGVTGHSRAFACDFSGRSGAPALFIVSDTSEDGRFWRLNTPDFNTIETAENQFTVIAPEGQRLHARILHPASGVQPRTGGFQRGSPYPYRTIGLTDDPEAFGTAAYTTQNCWVDFESGDGRFLVAMVLLPKDAPVPEVSARNAGGLTQISVGGQTITVGADTISVEGWSRPSLSIEEPKTGQQYNTGPGDITVGGRVEDADGIASVMVAMDGGAPMPARLDGSRWTVVLPGVAVGRHALRVTATDKVGDEATADLEFQVNRTQPPRVVITEPVGMIKTTPGQALELAGEATDPEGKPVRVEILAGGERIGTPEVVDGRFTFTWAKIPPGNHTVTVRAIDADGDESVSAPLTARATEAVGQGNVSDSASLWVGDYQRAPVSPTGSKPKEGFHPRLGGDERWAIRETDVGRVLRVRPTEKWDYRNRHLWILGSDKAKDWKLEWKMRMLSPLDGKASAMVLFGAGITGPLAMDFQTTNSEFTPNRRGRKGSGTRLWYLAPNDNRNEVGWTHNSRDLSKDQGETPRDFAGIPDASWHSYSMEKIGKKLTVRRDGVEILAADSPWVAPRGPVGFANDRMVGSEFEIRDIEFTPLR